jgi:hypothetical protein
VLPSFSVQLYRDHIRSTTFEQDRSVIFSTLLLSSLYYAWWTPCAIPPATFLINVTTTATVPADVHSCQRVESFYHFVRCLCMEIDFALRTVRTSFCATRDFKVDGKIYENGSMGNWESGSPSQFVFLFSRIQQILRTVNVSSCV